MIAPLLQQHLQPAVRRQRWLQFWRGLTLCWWLTALLGFGLIGLQGMTGWRVPFALPALVVLAVGAALVTWWRGRRSAPDYGWIARQIEQQNPQLHALLLTAIEQRPAAGGELTYLQQRVIREATEQLRRGNWIPPVSGGRLALAQAAHWAAVATFVLVLSGLRVAEKKAAFTRAIQAGVAITPGDATIEKGNSLVVLARFTGPLPAGVNLVLTPVNAPARSQSLVKSLDDPVFGGSVPEVAADFTYRLEYAGQRSREFTVKVFEHPRLERADAHLTFPAYTSLPEKRIADTRRVTALEGTLLDWSLQLNKPVASARLVPRGKDPQPEIPLVTATNQAVASLAKLPLTASGTYELQLVDADGRTNKVAPQFVIEVQPNRPPQLKFVAPRGDQRVSPLEEITFTAEAAGDYGLRAYGLAWSVGGVDPKFVELGQTVPAKERRAFSHLLALEELRVQTDDLIAYFVWADDTGPDGEPRRTTSDMFFAEVRPFEEIFRAGQSGEGEGEGEPPPGNPAAKLTELQKQIISATFKLQRQHTGMKAATPAPKPAPKAP